MSLSRRLILAIHYLLWMIAPGRSTKFICSWLSHWGVNIYGEPRYISARVWFDSTDFSLISLGHGCTISSNVRILTHDWAADTVGRSIGVNRAKPLGRVRPVAIGDHSFVGTGSIIMPGAKIGRGAIIGAGTVVRGEVEDFAIVVGSPGVRVGDSRDYVERLLSEGETEGLGNPPARHDL